MTYHRTPSTVKTEHDLVQHTYLTLSLIIHHLFQYSMASEKVMILFSFYSTAIFLESRTVSGVDQVLSKY
jgi:hypothetical protein